MINVATEARATRRASTATRTMGVQTDAPSATATPAWSVCPISCERFDDPVIAPNGVTYERAAVEAWLQSHDGHLPNGTVCTADALYRDQSTRDRLDAEADPDPDAPDWLLCPIGMAPMADPVTASDGRSYELETLKTLFKHGARSPFTRETLQPTVYRHGALASAAARQQDDTPASAERVVDLSAFVDADRPTMFGFARELWSRRLVRYSTIGSTLGGAAMGIRRGIGEVQESLARGEEMAPHEMVGHVASWTALGAFGGFVNGLHMGVRLVDIWEPELFHPQFMREAPRGGQRDA